MKSVTSQQRTEAEENALDLFSKVTCTKWALCLQKEPTKLGMNSGVGLGGNGGKGVRGGFDQNKLYACTKFSNT